MILGSMPLPEIRVGLRVKSGHTGNFGIVREVKQGKVDIDKVGWIEIQWDHGGITSQPFYDPDYGDDQAFNKIFVVEDEHANL